jgi:hypothetical protein
MATTAAIQAVQEAYIAYYGRPADPSGLTYWADRVDSEGGIDALIGEFGTSTEATTRFGALSINDAVDAIYEQIFNRVPDASGKAFYVDKLLRGEFTLVTIAQNIWDGASGADATITANKLTAAQSFTDALAADADSAALYAGNGAAQNARNWLSNVDATEASVTAASDSVDETIAALQDVPTNPGSTFALTTSTSDLINGTSKDDTITSVVGTLHTGDTVSDGFTDDNDVMNINITSTGLQPKLTNIETVNLQAEYLQAGLDLTNVLGTTTLNVDSNLLNGTGVISAAGTLAVDTINVGENIAAVRITTAASGTRDQLTVNLGGASGTITGGAGVDDISVNMGSGATLFLGTLASSTDKVTLSNVDSASNSIVGTSTLASTVINPSGNYTLNYTSDMGTGMTINTLAGDTLTLNWSGDTANLTGMGIVDAGEGTVVLNLNSVSAASVNLGAALVDEIRASSGVAAGQAPELIINQDSLLTITGDMYTALTVAAGTGTGYLGSSEGSVRLNLLANQSGATSKVIAHSSVGTLLLSSGTGSTTTTVNELIFHSPTTVLSLVGSNGITVNRFSADDTANPSIITAQNLAASLSFSAAANTTVNVTGSNSGDTVTMAGTASIIYGMGGDDTITVAAASVAATLYGGDGNDILVGNVGNDTIYTGAGNDIVRIALGTVTKDTIADFSVGTDIIQFTGSAHAINVGAQSGVSGLYALMPADTAGSVTLTGVTANDFSDSIQLGYSLNAQVLLPAVATAIVAGNLADHVVGSADVANTITLGGGADVVELALTQTKGATTAAISAATSLVVKDFTLGEDVIVLTGSADTSLGGSSLKIDAHSVAVSGGVYTFGLSAGITLQNGGTGLTTTDLGATLRFGHSGAGSDAFHIIGGTAATVVLGDLNDFVVIEAGYTANQVLTIKDNGGVDFITASSAVEIRYDLTGISADLVTGIAAGASKIANALSGSTYVFADGESGTASATVEYSGSASVAVGLGNLTGVATFLNAGLGGTTGETYLAVINDLSGNAAYTYLVVDDSGDGVITADELTMLTAFDITLGNDRDNVFEKDDLSA